MNERPLKILTINNPLPSFVSTIIICAVFALIILIPLSDSVNKIHAVNYMVVPNLIICSLLLLFIMGIALCMVYDAYKSNICYVSDILIKNDSFDIVYKKRFKTVNVQNVKISEIEDLKVEVEFISSNYIKFFILIYPKEGAEVIKFSSGNCFSEKEAPDTANPKYLYDIIKYFNAFDFFHIEFLRPAVCTKEKPVVF